MNARLRSTTDQRLLPWEIEHELLAQIADSLASLRWITVAVNRGPGAGPMTPHPDPITRPRWFSGEDTTAPAAAAAGPGKTATTKTKGKDPAFGAAITRLAASKPTRLQ